MKRWWRSTIRVRLTMLYATAFFIAGAMLVAIMYLYFGQSLDNQLSAREEYTEQLHMAQNVPSEFVDQLHARFEQDRRDTLRSMLVALLVSLAVIGVVAGGFGWLLAGRALRPLRVITATARRVADRSLHERIALSGPTDEIKDLADTFDAMLERLDHAFDGQRHFVANASHELRTPLTINRTLLEVALANPESPESLRQLGSTLLAVNQRHERLIDGLLTLASSEERLTVHTAVDLADLVKHLATESHTQAQEAGVTIRLRLSSAPVVGDPVLLERLVQNLIDNAIRYNIVDDGWVSISTGTEASTAWLTVDNPGPVVPNYETPALFEPFRRLTTTERRAPVRGSPGVGLGLSIVRSVAGAHGGVVHAEARPDGGLVIHVRLPAHTAGEAENSSSTAPDPPEPRPQFP
jgi:signal transduction histidine kinase